MKWIEDNWLDVLLIFVIVIVFVINNNNNIEMNKNIKILEHEKSQLKKQVAKSEIEIAKIRAEKKEIIKDYGFDLDKLAKISEDYEKLSKIKRKVIIRYRTKAITKETSQGELWKFSLNLHNDFSEYVKLDIKEQKETDKTIHDLKTINIKSEKIITFKDNHIKKLNKRNKRNIIVSAVAIITAILLLK